MPNVDGTGPDGKGKGLGPCGKGDKNQEQERKRKRKGQLMPKFKQAVAEALALTEVDSVTDVKVKSGKMKKLLGLDPDEKVSDKYSSGKALAQALLNKVKDKKEVTGMLAFAANVRGAEDVFDSALKALKDL